MAFVPTMGALHEGHLSLVRAGVEMGHPVIMSIYVNPTQFAPDEDFDAYPRPIEDDLAKAEAAGAQVVFVPDNSVMYPADEDIACPPLPSVATEPRLDWVFCIHSAPRVILELFHTKRNSLSFGIESNNLDIHRLTNSECLAWVINSAPGYICNVKKPVDSAEIHKCPIVCNVFHHTLECLSLLQISH